MAEAVEQESLFPKQSTKENLLQVIDDEHQATDFTNHKQNQGQRATGERKTTKPRIRTRRKLPSSSSSSSLFDDNASLSALNSNRDELINMTEALAMNLSSSSSSASSFSNSPTSSPNNAPIISHSGPHFADYDSLYYNDDPPPRGYDDFGNDNRQPHYSDPPPPSNEDEPTTREFYEFIAFICWYAFLVLCCLFPTLFAWHRRRRNARLIRESLAMVRGAAEANSFGRNIVRTGENGEGAWNSEVLAGGRGSGIDLDNIGGRGGSDLRLLEWMNNQQNNANGQRAQDWEFLEQLFGGSSTEQNNGGNNNDAEGNSFGSMFPTGGVTAHRRQIMMSDILSGMSVRILVEREERRRRERGRRLVAVLKQTSMEVKECHLIPKGRSNDQSLDTNIPDNATFSDSWAATHGLKTLGNQSAPQSETLNQIGKECKNDSLQIEPHSSMSAGNGGKSEGSVASLEASMITEKIPNKCFNLDDNLQPQQSSKKSVTDSTSFTQDGPKADLSESGLSSNVVQLDTTNISVEISDSVTATNGSNNTPQDRLQNSPNHSSLYQRTNPLVCEDEDDDEDNKYCALAIPFNILNHIAVASDEGGNSAHEDSSNDNSNTHSRGTEISGEPRVVSPVCAICLLSYTPGCYVTWSSNQGNEGGGVCLHCFHRDCILLWLLKKEEPLCPCCRREFVLSSVLNRSDDRSGTRAMNLEHHGVNSSPETSGEVTP